MTNPRKVDWTSDEDLRCAILAGLGFSTKFISEETGLTPCQIGYRLNKGRIKRADYRNGESLIAQRVIDRVIPPSKSSIRDLVGITNNKNTNKTNETSNR